MAVLGMIEFGGIVKGIRGSDAMIKAARVVVLQCCPIDPGKYLTIITGDLASVEASHAAGMAAAGAEGVVDSILLPNLHEQVLPALRDQVAAPECDALGVIETRSVASVVVAADAACKASPVQLLNLRLALHIGGKGYLLFVGDVADVEASVDAGGEAAGGHLLDSVVVHNPYQEFYDHLTGHDGGCPPLGGGVR